MENILEKAFNFGVNELYEDYLKSKIRTTNLVSFGLLGIAIAYSVFSWTFYPPLTFLPVAGVFLVLFALFFWGKKNLDWGRRKDEVKLIRL